MDSGIHAANYGEPMSVGAMQAAAFGPTGKGAFGDMKGNEGRIQVRLCTYKTMFAYVRVYWEQFEAHRQGNDWRYQGQ